MMDVAFRMARAAARPAVGHVYFLEALGLNRVKIGWSTRLHDRIVDLQNMCPVELRLLASRRCLQRNEFQLHRRFSALRIWPRREWFHLESPLREYLERHNSKRSILAPAKESQTQCT